MKNLLTRYRPRFVRSLIYMLQASEYHVRDYLSWYHRTIDFAHVEKRKHLVYTPKALVLITISWSFIVVWAVGLMSYAHYTGSDVPLVVLSGVVILTPFYFPYILALIVRILQFVQMPIEGYIVWRAQKMLSRHKGLKIAIAGSFGKTSMREVLKTVLSEGEAPTQKGRGPDRSVGRKKVAAPPFSYNTPLAIAGFVEKLKGDEEVLIFELGEYYPGDIMHLCKLIGPHIGIITGVNEAHLEKFGTLEKTTRAIFELAGYLKDKPVYVNGENELARARASEKHIVYSREGAGDCRAEDPKTNLGGTSFTIIKDGVRSRVNSELLGLHNIGPLAAAAHIAYRLGFTDREVQEGIGKTRAFDHRLQPSEDQNGVTTIDDSYNGNPDGVRAVIEFLSSIKGRRRWYVTPGLVEMGSRAKEVHEEIGRQLARAGIEKIVLTRNSVTPHIERGLKDAGYSGEILWFPDALQAFAALPHLTVKGDVVLLQNDWPDQYA